MTLRSGRSTWPLSFVRKPSLVTITMRLNGTAIKAATSIARMTGLPCSQRLLRNFESPRWKSSSRPCAQRSTVSRNAAGGRPAFLARLLRMGTHQRFREQARRHHRPNCLAPGASNQTSDSGVSEKRSGVLPLDEFEHRPGFLGEGHP
jgi:hypothetical protein